MDRKSGKPTPPDQSTDPFLYAASLNSFMTERNPFQILVGDLTHKIKTVVNLGKNRRLAQERIEHIQAQVEKVESNITHVNPKIIGNRLDKMR